MSTKVKEKSDTLIAMIDETLDYAKRFEKAAKALLKARPGTEAYEDAEADLSVNAFVLKLKAESVHEILDEED
jgi:ABC-type branched-subunit amino acid transport system substrate-binding protein